MFIVYASIWNIDSAHHANKYSIIIERRICQLNIVYNIFISIEYFFIVHMLYAFQKMQTRKAKLKTKKKGI